MTEITHPDLILTVDDHLRFRGVVYGPDGALTLWTLEFENTGREELAEMILEPENSMFGPNLNAAVEVIVPERVRKAKGDYRLIKYIPWENVRTWATKTLAKA